MATTLKKPKKKSVARVAKAVGAPKPANAKSAGDPGISVRALARLQAAVEALQAKVAELEEREAARRVKELTIPSAKLVELAKRNPPPPEWFDGEMEKPF